MQRILKGLGYLLGGALFLGEILNAIINSQQLIRDVSSAIRLSVAGLVIWAFLEILAWRGVIRWRTPETTAVIRSLGWGLRFGILGAFGLIWIPQALRVRHATESVVPSSEVTKIVAAPVSGCAAACSGWCNGEKCVPPVTLADAQLGAQGLAVNDGQLFWATKGIPDWPIIQSISVAGGAARVLAVGPGWPSIVAADSESVYWVEPQIGSVLAVRRDGGRPRTLWRGKGTPNGLALDATHVYWTDQRTGMIACVPKEGGRRRVLAQAQASPLGITAIGEHVVWANMGTEAINYTDGSIKWIHGDGTDMETLALNQKQPSVLIAVGNRLLWVSLRGNNVHLLMSLSLDRWPNSAPEQLAEIGRAQPLSLAGDSEHIYWTLRDSGPAGQVVALSLSGGSPFVVARDQELPWGVAVDSTAVYWTTQGSGSKSPGTLMKIEKPRKLR